MAGLGGEVSYLARQRLCNQIFTPPHPGDVLHPGDIFVAAFRSIVAPAYAQVIQSDARLQEGGAPLSPGQLPLRESTPYERALDALEAVLHPFSPTVARSTGLVVSDEGLTAARDVFRKHLVEATGAYEVVAVVYALMDAIEERLGSALITEFRTRHSPHSPRCSPVHPAKVLPKAPVAFGTDIVERSNFLSPTELLDHEVFLADAFGRLTATPYTDGYSLAPALHVHVGSGRAARERSTWRVAMCSILADVYDVDWRAAAGLFSGSALRNPRVRARLEWALEHCDRFEPDVIVIPELNVDAELKEVIQEWLAREPRGPDAVWPLVVYGALHTPDPGGAAGYRNQPGLLTPARELEWDYWKVNPVYNPADGTYENLGGGPPHVVAVDLPMGRVAVLICKDFLTGAVRRAVAQLRPTLLVVPAMTKPGSVEWFRNHAHDFASSLRCVTLFCNSSILLRAKLAATPPKGGALGGSPPKESADGGTLGVLQVNTRVRHGPASHPLGLTPSTAVLGLYTLSTSKAGVAVECHDERLTPAEEDVRFGRRPVSR